MAASNNGGVWGLDGRRHPQTFISIQPPRSGSCHTVPLPRWSSSEYLLKGRSSRLPPSGVAGGGSENWGVLYHSHRSPRGSRDRRLWNHGWLLRSQRGQNSFISWSVAVRGDALTPPSARGETSIGGKRTPCIRRSRGRSIRIPHTPAPTPSRRCGRSVLQPLLRSV